MDNPRFHPDDNHPVNIFSENKPIEEVLRESEARQAFLLMLSDHLRPLSNAVAVQETVTRFTREYFKTDRSYYCEIDGDYVTIRRDDSRPDLPSVAGHYSLSQMPVFRSLSQSGKPIVVNNVRTTDTVDDNLRELCIQLKVIGYINVPVMKDQQLVGNFCLTHCSPRTWTATEVQMAVEIAERTWAAVERARTEEALARSNQKIFEILSSITDDFYVLDRNWRFVYANKQFTGRIGKLPEDFIGNNIWEMFPKHVGTILYENFHASMDRGEKRRFEVIGQYTDACYSMTSFPSTEGITVIGTDITERKRAEDAQREQRVHLEIQRRLLEYREQERQAIALDLHDGPVQDINSLLFKIQLVKEMVKNPLIANELDKISTGLRSSVQNLREMINEMRPPSLIRFGLAKALYAFFETYRERHPEVLFQITLMEDGSRLSEPVRLGLFRILQEALTNIIKHAGASQVDVTLLCDDDQVVLEIHDNGKGFAVSDDLTDYSVGDHFGLVGMRERAIAAGGKFQIISVPGNGTIVKVSIPTGTP